MVVSVVVHPFSSPEPVVFFGSLQIKPGGCGDENVVHPAAQYSLEPGSAAGKNGKKRKGNGIKIRRAKLAERLTGEGEREASWPLPRVPLGSPIVFSGFFPYYGAWSQVASHGKERVTHA